MAYSPIEQGRLLNNRTLKTMAQARRVTAVQVAIVLTPVIEFTQYQK